MPTPFVIDKPLSAVKLKQGFDHLANLLAITLGPTQGAIVNHSTTKDKPEMLSDAATVARRMVALPDRSQDVGAMLLRQLVWRTHRQVGDGGATTAVLAQSILAQATRMVAAGANATLVQRGVKKAHKQAAAALQGLAQPVSGQEDLAAVANSVTGERELAWVLGEMFDLLGAQAHIQIENYVAPYLERAYFEGGRWQANIISPYLITAPTTGQSISKNCSVALFAGSLSASAPIKMLLDVAAQQKPPHLLLVAQQISGEALNLLVAVHQHEKSDIQVTAVKLGVGGDQGQRELQDLALLTGATLLGDVEGRPLDSVTAVDLGRAGRAEASKKELFVVQGEGDKSLLRAEISALQAQLAGIPLDNDERPKLQARQARLLGSAGVLKIGAHTKPARNVMRQKAEQGVKVLAAALEEGVLSGGGIAFVQAADAIDPDSADNADEKLGMIAFKQALAAPFFRLLQNAHVPAPAVILQDIMAAEPGTTYDIVAGKLCSAREQGLLDAAKCTRQVLDIAASGAMMALSVDVTILKRRPVTNVNYDP